MLTTQKHHTRLIFHFKCPEIITTQSRSVLHALSSLQRRICAHQSLLSKSADVLFIPEYIHVPFALLRKHAYLGFWVNFLIRARSRPILTARPQWERVNSILLPLLPPPSSPCALVLLCALCASPWTNCGGALDHRKVCRIGVVLGLGSECFEISFLWVLCCFLTY